MILIGRYFSPFVRRVGATLHHYEVAFEHRALRAAGDEQDEIRKTNPLGRVPALILDNGDVLSDSALILEYLDAQASPEKVLVPASGRERYQLLSLLATATGAMEKGIATFSEQSRPEDRRHPPYVDNCARQTTDGFQYLEQQVKGPWMWGDKLTQLDVSTTAYWEFMRAGTPEIFAGLDCPRIAAIVERALELPAFKATSFET